MNSTELAINWFCATQAEEKLRRDEVCGKQKTEQTHFEVLQKVRQTITELAGTVLEGGSCPEIPDDSGAQCGAVIAVNESADLN